MRIKEFYKDGQVYDFDVNRMFVEDREKGFNNREEVLIADGYMPVFDKRTMHYETGKGGSIILENDVTPPVNMIDLQDQLKDDFSKTHKQFTSLHPGHFTEINQLLKDRVVKNILIDSLFEDVEQFRYVIIKCFSGFTDVNYFINSHGQLIQRLQDEVENNMDKYPVCNSYYKHANGECWFNELTFTLIKNNIYEFDGKTAKRIKFKTESNKNIVLYDGEYKWINENYPVIDGDRVPEKKSKWTI